MYHTVATVAPGKHLTSSRHRARKSRLKTTCHAEVSTLHRSSLAGCMMDNADTVSKSGKCDRNVHQPQTMTMHYFVVRTISCVLYVLSKISIYEKWGKLKSYFT